ncbi:MAG: hypothetical protein AAFV95_00065 [Bacteroidota bacterium]
MYKYLLQSVENINWLAIIPLLLFMSIFLISSYRILRQKKHFIDKMAGLPLEDIEPIENSLQ